VRGDPSLGVARPAQTIVTVQRSSPQAVAGSGLRPQASSCLVGSFWHRILRRACNAAGTVSERVVVARRSRQPSSKGEGCWRHKKRRRKAGPVRGRCVNAASRIRENRMLAGVSVRRNVTAEVVGRQSDPEKRVSAFPTRPVTGRRRWIVAMGGDGGLARGNRVCRESGTRGIASEGAPRFGP